MFSFSYSKALFLFVLTAVGLYTLDSCQKWVRPSNERTISTFGDDESVDDDHQYNGYNCMNCHYTEGRGTGWFSVAGTIFGNPGDAVVRVYNDVNQNPIMEVQADMHGNFYTTDDIDIKSGVFVSVQPVNGPEEFMEDKIFTGQCNMCHGVSTSKLSY